MRTENGTSCTKKDGKETKTYIWYIAVVAVGPLGSQCALLPGPPPTDRIVSQWVTMSKSEGALSVRVRICAAERLHVMVWGGVGGVVRRRRGQ